ncbi:hypothetical protein [Acidipila sp. EB88]|uniref:hypothetical protein n=1 Tax=Acidipila sp. EB88 TaxID=2305226 RepID=UPI000F5FF2CF|nr:hypothetical protein [Acidipila sp. EB88]
MEFEPFKISSGEKGPVIVSRTRARILTFAGADRSPEEEAVRSSGFCFADTASTHAPLAKLKATYCFTPGGKAAVLPQQWGRRTFPPK